jgi:hypothetical protein
MNKRKGIQTKIYNERREAKSKYHFLLFVFIYLVITVSWMIHFFIVIDVLSGNFPSNGFLPFCAIGPIIYITFLLILPDLFKYRSIYKGKEGIWGLEWSTESDSNLSWGFLYFGITAFFTFALIAYLIIERDFRGEFIGVIVVLIVTGYATYLIFSNILRLGKYKFKIFDYPDEFEPKEILEEILKKVKLNYEYYLSSKRSIHSEFDLVLKTELGIYVRLRKIKHENRYWISIGPKNRRNEEKIKELMMILNEKFGTVNDIVER